MPERIANELSKLRMSMDKASPTPSPPFWRQYGTVILGAVLAFMTALTSLQLGWSREDQRTAAAEQRAAQKELAARLDTMQAMISTNAVGVDRNARDVSNVTGQVGQLTQRLEAGQTQRIDNDRIFDGKLAAVQQQNAVLGTKVDILLRKVEEARRDGAAPFGQNQIWPYPVPEPPFVLRARIGCRGWSPVVEAKAG